MIGFLVHFSFFFFSFFFPPRLSVSSLSRSLWPLYSMRYMLLIQKYASLIEGQFYGHDHVDEVRIQNKCKYATPDGTTSSVQSCDGEAVANIYIGKFYKF